MLLALRKVRELRGLTVGLDKVMLGARREEDHDHMLRAGWEAVQVMRGEPIQFHAEWRADQNVSAVRFEIPQTDSNEPVLVDLPVTAGTSKADTEQTLTGLTRGQTVPVYVHVTMQPSGADRVLQVKLQGGQFRAEDRRVTLEDLKVGEGALMDMTAYTWEPVEIPLRAVFSFACRNTDDRSDGMMMHGIIPSPVYPGTKSRSSQVAQGGLRIIEPLHQHHLHPQPACVLFAKGNQAFDKTRKTEPGKRSVELVVKRGASRVQRGQHGISSRQFLTHFW